MTRDELARLVLRMRREQKAYFRSNKSKAVLDESKRLERQVDLALEECLSQPTLFGDEDEGRPR